MKISQNIPNLTHLSMMIFGCRFRQFIQALTKRYLNDVQITQTHFKVSIKAHLKPQTDADMKNVGRETNFKINLIKLAA